MTPPKETPMADCLEGDCLKLKRKRAEQAKSIPAYETLLNIFEHLMEVTEAGIDKIRGQLKPLTLSPYMENKFQEGLPLVDRKNFPVSDEAFDTLLDLFFGELSGFSGAIDRDLKILESKRADGTISGKRLIDQFVMGSEMFLPYIFEVPEINNHLLFFVLRNIFKICLIPYQKTLTEELTALWEKGECPVCGFPPDMGILRGEGGKLYLHCAICGHEWKFKRMACAFCGNDLQKELKYLEIEGDDVHKIYLCHLCHKYLKVVDTRSLPEDFPVFLDLEELTSLHLDVIADQQGYSPGINL